MKLIDKEYTRHPFYGIPRMTKFLQEEGYPINHKRIERLMKIMDIHGIAPRKKLSNPDKNHKKYPYLLRHLNIERPNQVWCSDITYIPMNHGFLYLVAILDWYSRYVISWEISNTLDTEFCEVSLRRALRRGTPEIFNTDQGVQFNSNSFTSILQEKNIKISMDSVGRALDNIIIERFWRTLKYENVYIQSYETVSELISGLSDYFKFYNNERYHSSLDYKTPSKLFLNVD